MSAIDYIIIGIVISGIIFAVFSIIKSHHKGNYCTGCSGNCQGCQKKP